jgi:dehydrogenase/reductase SDR family protein 7B
MTPRDIFHNKAVWITGASSGIGEALARRLAVLGARLILSSNQEDELWRVANELKGAEVRVLPLDLGELDTLPEKAGEALACYGRVDFLFNNGGITQRALARDTDLTVDKRIMDVDYFGQIILTKAVLPTMIQQGSGHFVVTTSVMGIMSAPYRSAYCAAKHALHGFFDALRAEVWQDGIRVTLVAPAAVQTEISRHALTEAGNEYGKMDPLIAGGISADECARQILTAVVKGKEQIVPGRGKGKIGVWLHRFFPNAYARVIRRPGVV